MVGYHEYRGRYLEYRWRYYTLEEYDDTCGRYHDTYEGHIMTQVGGYHTYRGSVEYRGGAKDCTPTVLNTPHGTHDPPTPHPPPGITRKK